MKIKKSKKEDFHHYLPLKKESIKEYSKLIKEKLNTSDINTKREFDLIFRSKELLLLAEKNNKAIGYLNGAIIEIDNKKTGYIDDIFVLKEFRGGNVGKLLIEEFIRILKNKKIGACRLEVNLKNKKALELYKKLGFKVTEYVMDKKLR